MIETRQALIHELHLLLEKWKHFPEECPSPTKDSPEGENPCPEMRSAEFCGKNPWHLGYFYGGMACANELLDLLAGDD